MSTRQAQLIDLAREGNEEALSDLFKDASDDIDIDNEIKL